MSTTPTSVTRWYIVQRKSSRSPEIFIERPGVGYLDAAKCPTHFDTEVKAEAQRRTWEEKATRWPVGTYVKAVTVTL